MCPWKAWDGKDVTTYWSDSVKAWHGESCMTLILAYMRWLSSNLLIRWSDDEVCSNMTTAHISLQRLWRVKAVWRSYCPTCVGCPAISWYIDAMMKFAATWQQLMSVFRGCNMWKLYDSHTGQHALAVLQSPDTLMWQWNLQQHEDQHDQRPYQIAVVIVLSHTSFMSIAAVCWYVEVIVKSTYGSNQNAGMTVGVSLSQIGSRGSTEMYWCLQNGTRCPHDAN